MRVLALALVSSLLLQSSGTCAEFESDGVNIQYSVAGEGQPVVLIHGLYSSAAINWDLPGITAALAKTHQVITFDNRGHGESGKPREDGQYGTKMVEDVPRLLDHLRIPRADIAGYSLGGMIALKLAAMHPDRINRVVLGGMGWLRKESPLEHFWDSLSPRGPQIVPAACLREIGKLSLSETEVRGIKAPVTVLIGELDPCLPLYVKPLEIVRPDWPVTIIPSVGHLTCVGSPKFKDELLLTLNPRRMPAN